jgi:hypothetical protein
LSKIDQSKFGELRPNKEVQNMLSCKTCGAPVKQVEAILQRTCEHKDAPIIANMVANAKGAAVLK